MLAVTLLVIDNAPAPVTLKPAPTETPPTAEVVALGKSLAARATVEVINPSALYVIPERVAAPPETALLIPRLPLATFNERSRLEVFNFAGVIVPSAILVTVTAFAAIFASITALLANAPESTALSAKAVASTAFAASLALVTASSAIFAVVTALSAIALEANVPESFAAVKLHLLFGSS